MIIKLFEEFGSNWKIISWDEYYSYMFNIISSGGGGSERSEILNKDKIRSVFDKIGIEYQFYPSKDRLLFLLPKTYQRVGRPYIEHNKIVINELEDEWFLIRHISWSDSDYDFYSTCYKCDQWDGLLECLTEILDEYK